jgi:catechol 2,3-dioxygenase-like lactoylglutathione lyase family enzyme
MSHPNVSTRDVLIQTPDIETAGAFYEKLLGLKEFYRTGTMIGLEAGALRLFIDKGEPYGPVFEFLVKDIRKAKDRLVAAGCRVEQDDPSIPRCYVRDPYGLVFNIAEKS